MSGLVGGLIGSLAKALNRSDPFQSKPLKYPWLLAATQ